MDLRGARADNSRFYSKYLTVTVGLHTVYGFNFSKLSVYICDIFLGIKSTNIIFLINNRNYSLAYHDE